MRLKMALSCMCVFHENYVAYENTNIIREAFLFEFFRV